MEFERSEMGVQYIEMGVLGNSWKGKSIHSQGQKIRCLPVDYLSKIDFHIQEVEMDLFLS